MVNQDMQAALGVTSYQGRWALILDSVGETGPTLSLENNNCFLMADKIRLYSVKGRKNSVLERLKLQDHGKVFCKSTCCPHFVSLLFIRDLLQVYLKP